MDPRYLQQHPADAAGAAGENADPNGLPAGYTPFGEVERIRQLLQEHGISREAAVEACVSHEQRYAYAGTFGAPAAAPPAVVAAAAPAAASPGSSSHRSAARRPAIYTNTISDAPLKEWLLDVNVWMHANNITGGTQQFSNALTLLASNVKLLVFGENIGELLDDPRMDFEYFKQRMEGSSLGTGMRTDLQRMYGINAVRTDTSKPCSSIATLGLLESMFSEMEVKLCDLSKIFYTHKAMHPGIKDRIAYQQDGSPWPSWDTFRKHLISLAAHFDATVNSRPSGNPGGYTRGGARDTRRMLRGNTQATTSAAPAAAAAAGNLRSPGWHPPSRGGSVGGRGGGGGGGRGRGRFHPYQRPAGEQRRPAAAAAAPGEIICWHCRQPGHVQATCPLKTASGSGQVSEGGVCGAVCATISSGEEQEQ
jgi:hypothetical protein